MNLTLEVVSPNARDLGAQRRKVLGVEGGRIGRAPECDWVLPNPYISRHHATIRWISGKFHIESTGENGVAVGSAQAMLPKLERRALNDGDRLFIDEYEIAVAIVGATSEALPSAFGAGASAGFAPSEDPFQPSAEELDPLKNLTGRFQAPPITAPRHEAGWNHTPSLADQFTPPAVPAGGGAIPDDWDKTSFGRGKAAASAAAPAGAAIPDDWDKTSFGRQRAQAAPSPVTAAPPTPPPRAPIERAAPAPARPQPACSPQVHAMPQAAAATPTRPAAPATAAGAELDLAALLRNAGVDPATLPPETAASLGYILRTVVQGVIDVLRARSEIKSQFRLSMTRVKTAENNPLKFAVNAEDALSSLLGRRSAAYLGPAEAFEDAFDDIRFHQLAMLAGMRAGFEQLLERFEPGRLQDEFEKQVKRGGLLGIGGKSRYWELYAEMFERIAGDREEAFRRLFGEEFAAAYEKQLEVLKRAQKRS